jgi:hypothetical protein
MIFCKKRLLCRSLVVLATSEVIPSRALTALEGVGRGLSYLEVVARGPVVTPASQ